MYRALASLGLVCVLASPAHAQQDPTVQLLQEVRLLRQAIESLVATGSRVQIVFGRLQLQEQRTATTARRLDDLREALARVSREASEISARLQDVEERLRDSRGNPEERAGLENELQQLKRVVTFTESERQRLQNEESLAAGALASEQARWGELNQQLEDLERALTKR